LQIWQRSMHICTKRSRPSSAPSRQATKRPGVDGPEVELTGGF
jgi:hypothetical protein